MYRQKFSQKRYLSLYMNLIIVSPHQGVKLVLAGDGSERYVAYELTFIEFIQGWIELFSAGA